MTNQQVNTNPTRRAGEPRHVVLAVDGADVSSAIDTDVALLDAIGWRRTMAEFIEMHRTMARHHHFRSIAAEHYVIEVPSRLAADPDALRYVDAAIDRANATADEVGLPALFSRAGRT